jgi:hypothetical protein
MSRKLISQNQGIMYVNIEHEDGEIQSDTT